MICATYAPRVANLSHNPPRLINAVLVIHLQIIPESIIGTGSMVVELVVTYSLYYVQLQYRHT
jgi:hypothetical protein